MQQWWDAKAWLDRHQPEQLSGYRPPASDAAISKAEATLGRALPEDYKSFMRIHNGCTSDTKFVEWCSLVQIERIPELYAQLSPTDGDDDLIRYSDDEMRRLWFSEGWIPIGESPRGIDLLCIDFDPTEVGSVGQVVFVDLADDERYCLAPSFSELLVLYLEQLQTGEIKF